MIGWRMFGDKFQFGHHAKIIRETARRYIALPGLCLRECAHAGFNLVHFFPALSNTYALDI
jgi:hypothetical protein